MIPDTWLEHRRDHDDELLGYIVEAGGRYSAHTIVGNTIGEADDEADAAALLDAAGLTYLADRWLLTLHGRDDPIAVQIAEASPDAVVVRSVDLGYEGDYGTPFRLDVPIDPERLRPEKPIR